MKKKLTKRCIVCGYHHYAKYLCGKHWQRAYLDKREHPDEPFLIGEYVVMNQNRPGTLEGRIVNVHYRSWWISVKFDNGKQEVVSKWDLRKITSPFEEIILPLLLPNPKTF